MTTSGFRLITALLLGLLLLLFLVPTVSADANPIEQAIAAANEQRYDEALELVTPLANEGNPQAQNMLGALYAQGWGVEQDFVKAREWYEKAAAGGSPRAYFNLARMYALGNGVEKDCDKAVELWRTPAEQGDPVAQVNVASLYMEGFECMPQDSDEALRWYRLAAEQDDPLAQHSLGAIYATGQGVELDYATAMEWYQKAAAQGHANSQAALGWMYFSGEGVAPNIDKAREWYELAAAQGNERAIQALAAIGQQEEGTTPGDIDAMVEMYRAAPAKDVVLEWNSLVLLSQMLDYGFTIVIGDLEINDSNRDVIRADVEAKREAIRRAVEIRGVADIAGDYKAEVTSACSKIQSGWADGTRRGLFGAPSFEQQGHEVRMIQLADFNGKEPMETPVVIIENVLAFTDMMNSDFPFIGIVEGKVITITPQTDRILAAWPDWVKAPSKKNLDRCKVTLTRQ